MTETPDDGNTVRLFINRWEASGAAERANCQPFLCELCDLLGVPRPDPAGPDDALNAYVFERAVTFHNGDGTTSTGRIDLYKRDCFVLEAKQGSDQLVPGVSPPPLGEAVKFRRGTAVRGTKGWDDAMVRARGQAEAYAKALPADDGWPPFLIVVDVGHSIELFADFARAGKHYTQFPDASSFRIRLRDLDREDVRARLRLIWTDPLALDPARRAARVTREIADRLARLAKSLEADGRAPKSVAGFLMRCLFTMFAEDVGLLPKKGFSELLESLKGAAEKFRPMATSLWQTMNRGGFSPVLRDDLLRFNGGLFMECDAVALTEEQLALLIEAAMADWKDVEPAIFGTLLERALDPRERHKLGAHYTPRAYVERLVMPTVIEPLREEWDNVKAAAVTLANKGQANKAVVEVKEFHRRLCAIRVLDPACGSGNFLYVTLEHMKRLEGEVLDLLTELGETQYFLELERHTVDPHQFLGLEINPRAVVIAELVLWIGFLQWHFKTRGRTMPAQPVLKNFRNIEHRDAVLAWDRIEMVHDQDGKPVTRWDGRTYKKHPVTGADVPDETARVEVERYVNPRMAQWPKADYIVGNPPYIGGKDVRSALGDGYVEALWRTHDDVPQSADYVMYWWHQAALLVRSDRARRFGFITTNSLSQTFNRRVVDAHLQAKNPLTLAFAIPDHPWVDAVDGANVRVAMTVGASGEAHGILCSVGDEIARAGEERDLHLDCQKGPIRANLRLGADLTTVKSLMANDRLSSRGVQLHGSGFIVTREQARKLGLGRNPGLEKHIREYRNGRDLTSTPRGVMVIDLFGLEIGDLRERFPEVYQWVYERVKPGRDANIGRTKDADEYAAGWWRFGKPRQELRLALVGLARFIATVETSKHRFFTFLDSAILPDNMLVNIALDDAYFLGVLSSRPHVHWALAVGGTLEDRPRYNKTRCFDPFPFPDCSDQHVERIREFGEALDGHRKARQALNPELTMTGMYNVLEKLKTGAALTAKEKVIHENGLVSVLKQIHDDLDAAVFDAYGWAHDLSDEQILERLVALNKERAAEEARGLVRWLRPELQCPEAAERPRQVEMEVAAVAPAEAKPVKVPWPKSLADQAQAVRVALGGQPGPVSPKELTRSFRRANRERVAEILATLAALGQARHIGEDRYAA